MRWGLRSPVYRKDPDRCRITVEWCGYYIGRHHCSTHGTKWEDRGGCPAKRPTISR